MEPSFGHGARTNSWTKGRALESPLQTLGHDARLVGLLGRIGIGRIDAGTIRKGQQVAVMQKDKRVNRENYESLPLRQTWSRRGRRSHGRRYLCDGRY